MIRAVEFAAFVGVAAALHAGALGLAGTRIGSPQGAGAGGSDAATVAAADPALARTVERWREAPEAERRAVRAPAPPRAADAPASPPPNAAPLRQAAPQVPPLPATPDAAPDLASVAPQADARSHAPQRTVAPAAEQALHRPRPVVDEAPRGRTAAAPPAAPPPANAPRRPPEPSPPAITRNPPADSPRPTARPGERPAPAPAARRAAGAGGGPVAGRGGPEIRPALSTEARESRMATWGGRIRNAVERGKRYPAGARAAGTATVTLRIGADGQLLDAGLVDSAGSAALDRAALDAVRTAGRFPAAPDGLGPGPFDFRLRIAFTR